MRRDKTVAQILLVLSVVHVALAGPEVVRQRHLDVTEDATALSKKSEESDLTPLAPSTSSQGQPLHLTNSGSTPELVSESEKPGNLPQQVSDPKEFGGSQEPASGSSRYLTEPTDFESDRYYLTPEKPDDEYHHYTPPDSSSGASGSTSSHNDPAPKADTPPGYDDPAAVSAAPSAHDNLAPVATVPSTNEMDPVSEAPSPSTHKMDPVSEAPSTHKIVSTSETFELPMDAAWQWHHPQFSPPYRVMSTPSSDSEAGRFISDEVKRKIKTVAAVGALFAASAGIVYGVNKLAPLAGKHSSRAYVSPHFPLLATYNRVTNILTYDLPQ
jgi:hypothetical protein